jgi:hypothetical protein
MLATYVLSDIGTAEALRYERTLSHDADLKVAELARRKVGHWGKQNPYEAPGFERATPEHPRNF